MTSRLTIVHTARATGIIAPNGMPAELLGPIIGLRKYLLTPAPDGYLFASWTPDDDDEGEPLPLSVQAEMARAELVAEFEETKS